MNVEKGILSGFGSFGECVDFSLVGFEQWLEAFELVGIWLLLELPCLISELLAVGDSRLLCFEKLRSGIVELLLKIGEVDVLPYR